MSDWPLRSEPSLQGSFRLSPGHAVPCPDTSVRGGRTPPRVMGRNYVGPGDEGRRYSRPVGKHVAHLPERQHLRAGTLRTPPFSRDSAADTALAASLEATKHDRGPDNRPGRPCGAARRLTGRSARGGENDLDVLALQAQSSCSAVLATSDTEHGRSIDGESHFSHRHRVRRRGTTHTTVRNTVVTRSAGVCCPVLRDGRR